MFIKNPSSINQKTIHCTQSEYEFLIEKDLIPLSKDEKGWIFLDTIKIRDYLKKLKGGDI